MEDAIADRVNSIAVRALSLGEKGQEIGRILEVIDDIASHDIPVGQLLVEFHYRKGDRLALERVSATITTLESAGFVLIARSDGGQEFSFMRTGPWLQTS